MSDYTCMNQKDPVSTQSLPIDVFQPLQRVQCCASISCERSSIQSKCTKVLRIGI